MTRALGGCGRTSSAHEQVVEGIGTAVTGDVNKKCMCARRKLCRLEELLVRDIVGRNRQREYCRRHSVDGVGSCRRRDGGVTGMDYAHYDDHGT